MPVQNEAPELTSQINAAKDVFAFRLSHAAHRIHATLPQAGALGQISGALAKGLTQSAAFLRKRSVADLLSEGLDVVRRHPLPFALAAVGAGIGIILSKPRTTH